MSITSAFVLFAVIWFLVLLLVLPVRLKTQGEAGAIVPGTHSSAPDNPQIGKRMRITTIISMVLWCIIAAIIVSGWISVRDFDVFDVMPPVTEAGETNG